MQLVTPQGEEDDVVARGLWVQHDLAPPPAAAVDIREAEREARLLREKEEAEYVAECAMLELPVVAAPPLPDGATEADRDRFLREDLKALYGR